MPRLSREEKNNLSFHLNFALTIIFLFGLAIGVIGYLNIKLMLVIIGSFTSMCPIIYLMFITYKQQLKDANELRAIPLKELATIKSELYKAEIFLRTLAVEGGVELCFSTKKDSLNHISLERLIDGLKERLLEIEIKLNSNNISTVEEAIGIFNSPLSFPKRNSKNLIDHEMPDMPKSTWIDSMHFLIKELKDVTY